MNTSLKPSKQNCRAFTLVEIMISIAISAVAIAALMSATSRGFDAVKQARDDLRATQIMAQRLEIVRLYTWSQLNDASYLSTATFTESYNPLTTNVGVVYSGNYSVSDFPYDVSYSNGLKKLSVTLVWTNGTLRSNGVTVPYVHTRTMDSVICSNGLQRYIF